MELWTAFLLGLVGSLHCVGMCGPLALALPASGSSSAAYLTGRLLYNLGRIATYGLLGAAFGLLGQTLALAGLQRWISLGAGIAILLGLTLSSRYTFNAPFYQSVAWLKKGLGTLLRRPGYTSLFALGSLNGLLPCGLVYVACAAATTTGGFSNAVGYMLLFGLGTVPMMLALSLAGGKIQGAARLKFQKIIPLCLLLVAFLLILRGLALGIPYLSPQLGSAGSPPSCCH